MAFTFTDQDGKVTGRIWGSHKATVSVAVEVGDLLCALNTGVANTYQLADDSDGKRATHVAVQSGAAGDEITVAVGAELAAPEGAPGVGGVVTPSYFAASTDFLGADLFLGESGKASSAVGSTGQKIGELVARDRILFNPTAYSEPVATTIADPGDAGAIPVTKSGTVPIVTAGAETRTLADPSFPGQILNIGLKTDGGNAVITTTSPVNQTGNNTLTGADVGDHIALIAIEDGSDIEWRVLANDGWGLTTV